MKAAGSLLAPFSVPLSSLGGSELTPYDVPELCQGSLILLPCLLELLSEHTELLLQLSDLLFLMIWSHSTAGGMLLLQAKSLRSYVDD